MPEGEKAADAVKFVYSIFYLISLVKRGFPITQAKRFSRFSGIAKIT